jgi:hypothetical protein
MSRSANEMLPVISFVLCTAAILGCASTGETPSGGQKTTATTGSAAPIPSRYKADDGRPIEIGKSTPSEGGLRFKEPHMTVAG